jgi:hypothetical protein
MPFPIKTCAVCGEEFELRPGKPGFANRCPTCSVEEASTEKGTLDAGNKEQNAHRRAAIKDLLYRKDT